MTAPLVTIGMPVRNGEPHLSRAVDSLLAQSVGDFELILADNASADGTGEICRKYEALDPRVSYVRRDRNIGAARNFNDLVLRARGRYFKWAAHDDWIEPEFLASCVDLLEHTPDAVLCWTGTVFVDASGEVLAEQRLRGDPTTLTPSVPVTERVRCALHIHPGPPLFGVIRRRVLEDTGLIRPLVGGDRVLVTELSLRGGFGWIPRPLMFYTDYPEVRTGYYSGDWWDPLSPTHHPVTAFVLQARECSRAVLATEVGPATKASLIGCVARKYAVRVVKRVGWEIRSAGSGRATQDRHRVPDGAG